MAETPQPKQKNMKIKASWMAWRLCSRHNHALGHGNPHRQLSGHLSYRPIDVTFSASLAEFNGCQLWHRSVGKLNKKKKEESVIVDNKDTKVWHQMTRALLVLGITLAAALPARADLDHKIQSSVSACKLVVL